MKGRHTELVFKDIVAVSSSLAVLKVSLSNRKSRTKQKQTFFFFQFETTECFLLPQNLVTFCFIP